MRRCPLSLRWQWSAPHRPQPRQAARPPRPRHRQHRRFLSRSRRRSVVVRPVVGQCRAAIAAAAGHGLGRQPQPQSLSCAGARQGGPGGLERRSAGGPAGRSDAEQGVRHLCARPSPRPARRHLCRCRAQADPAVRADRAQPGGGGAVAGRLCRQDGLDEPDLRAASPGARQPHVRNERQRQLLAPTSSGRGRCRRAGSATSSSTRRRRGCTCTKTARWWIRCGSSPAVRTRSPRRR